MKIQIIPSDTLSKVQMNKNEKLNKLLESALKLFTDKDIKHVSIQDIVDHAGVAKGTFYLYFKNKEDLEKKLITIVSSKVIDDALRSAEKQSIERLDDKIIYIIDYIIDFFINNNIFLTFIKKNLSYGLYNEKLNEMMNQSSLGLQELFVQEVHNKKLNIENPEVLLFIIIELSSATLFSSIINNVPLPIQDYKPILYKTIKQLINE